MTADPLVIARLKETAGPKGFSQDPQEIAPHLVEWRGKYRGKSPLLLKPQWTAEVSRILAICNETCTPVVPQGGNTGLVGGQIPLDGEVLLSTARLNRIRSVDTEGMSAVVEAGVILAQFQTAADAADRYFPLSLASEGTCTIGGNISTNAGGVNVLRYGNMRQLVLGIEAVMADGRVLEMLRTLPKDNTGYDLKQLLIGAEGTLGIVTAAALKLFPRPRSRVTTFAAVPDTKSAIALLHALEEATGGLVSAFELLPRVGLEMVLAHIPQTHDPLSAPSPWYVLVEAESGAHPSLKETLELALSAVVERGFATDAVFAESLEQRAHLWRLRDSLSEVQRHEGGSIKHDISVPIGAIPEFLACGIAAVEQLVPGVRPVPFGHLGDGNIHFNFSMPKGGDSKSFLARWEEINHVIHDLVHQFGGSISAEHGIGVMKRHELARYKTAGELETMRAVKRALDPNNILNPGKVIPLA